MTAIRFRQSIVVAITLLSLAHLAHAQDPTWREPGHIEGKAGFMIKPLTTPLLSEKAQVTLFALVGRASYEIFDSITVEGSIGFATSTVVQKYETFGSFRTANPTLGATYRRTIDSMRLEVGGSLALPLASVRTTVEQRGPDQVALLGAAAMDGSMDLWLWMPERFSVVGHAKVRVGTPGRFELTGEAAVAAMFFAGGGTQDTEIFAQAAAEGYTFISEQAAAGVRLQMSWLTTGQAGDFVEDPVQLSVQPFLQFDATPAYGRLLLTLNIDDPAGFAFDENGGYYGLLIVAGRTF